MNSSKLTIKDSALSFLMGFLLCQVAVVVVTCVAMFVYKFSGFDTNLFSSFLNTASGYLITSLSLYVVMIAVFFYFNKNKENKIHSKPNFLKLLKYIIIAIISFLTLYPIITCVDSLLVKCGVKISTLPYNLTTKNYFISLLPLVIAPAICEELLFRGAVFGGLKKHGKTFAIIISSLMFSLFHMSISQTLYPILMGLMLAVIMFYENNIYYCIAVHMTNNFLSLTLSYFKINLIFNHWTYILIAIILFITFLSLILTLAIKGNNLNKKEPKTKTDKIFLIGSLSIMCLIWIMVNFI